MPVEAKPIGPISQADQDRFWSRVTPGENGCWIWNGSTSTRGYGSLRINGRNLRAHRVSLTLAKGRELGADMAVDHQCRNRACVNPAHLREVTAKINALENSEGFSAVNAAKTHCANGHPFSGDNLKVRHGRGYRICRTCKREEDLARLRRVRHLRPHRTPEPLRTIIKSTYNGDGTDTLELECGHTAVKTRRKEWYARTRCSECQHPSAAPLKEGQGE